LEFLSEPLPVTRAKTLLNSRSFDSAALFGDAKTNLVEDFTECLTNFKPHVVIFSTVVEDTKPQLEELLSAIKNFPSINHIVGGVYTIMAPEIAIKNPNIQCIGTGEGEEVIQEFCEKVLSGIQRPKNIKGTWVRSEDGSIIKNPPGNLVNIDDYLPDYSLFDDRRFLRPLGAKVWKAVSLETYRGCPYTCTFCNSPAKNTIAEDSGQGNFLRRKSIDVLRNEIKGMILDYDCEFLYINDDAFMARPKSENLKVAEMLKEFKLPFWFQTRFEDITKETLQAFKDAGCYRISFGLEHGNENFRKKRLLRNFSNKNILEKAKIISEVGIPYTINVIIGMPFETRELIFETIDLIREIGSWDALSVNTFVPYHKTLLREDALKEGWLDPDKLTTSVISESILEMPEPYLNSKEILGLVKTMPLYSSVPKPRYGEIREAELEEEMSGPIFSKLKEEWYKLTYGTDEKERNLTYQG
jgi:radical SAM superfamily enzyme YgiQ (UPF0313 family)